MIANQMQSLKSILEADQQCQVVILHGQSQEQVSELQWPESSQLHVSTQAIAGLGYDQRSESEPNVSELADRLLNALRANRFVPDNTVIHAHNHSLGKNVSLPGALNILAREGYPLLLQIHDFVEDFRVEQYQHLRAMLGIRPHALGQLLYPQAPHIHYAVLNERDHRILSAGGVPAERLHVLTNPIVSPGKLPESLSIREEMELERGIPTDAPLVIYPVRGIRRKNLGEFLLWGTLFKSRASFGTTLAPDNEAEIPSYKRWKLLAQKLDLPCHFELGDSFSFKQNLAAADAVITTSVAEGFGMVFLESQLIGQRLLGRDLPEITTEFSKNGINLDLLYQVLTIPVEVVDKDRLIESITTAYSKLVQILSGKSHNEQSARSSLDQLLKPGTIDFGILTPDLQEEVILQVHNDQETVARILELNPVLEKGLFPQDAQSATRQAVASNSVAIKNYYDPTSIGRKLHFIYRNLIQSPRETAVSYLDCSETILESFLSLERFRPVRSMS